MLRNKGGNAKPKKWFSNLAVYAIIGFLIVALAGFGVDNFNQTVDTVAHIGKREISVNRYVNALRSQQQNFLQNTGQSLSFADMRAAGLDRSILGVLIRTGALEDETRRLGFSLSNERLSKAVLNQLQMGSFEGETDKQRYRRIVRDMGTTVKKFEQDLRLQIAAIILRSALEGVALPNKTYTETIISYIMERRSFEWATLTKQNINTVLPDASEAALRAYYEEHKDEFIVPETRHITYIGLTPAMLAQNIIIEEHAVKSLYDRRVAVINKPERRLVDRLVFQNIEQARVNAEMLKTGEKTFDEILSDLGFLPEDVDLGEVEKNNAMLGGAGEVVFNLNEPGITDLFETDIGPAIFRINAILAPIFVGYEMMQDDLRNELALIQVKEKMRALIDPIDDLLAGGATLEEIANETDLILDEIAFSTDIIDGFGADKAFREAAFQAQMGDFPELFQRDDGGIFALRLEQIESEKLQPLEEVKAELRAAWRADEEQKAIKSLGEKMALALQNGQDFEDFNITKNTTKGQRRLEINLPPSVIEAVFDLGFGQATEIEDGEKIYVVRRIRHDEDNKGNEEKEIYEQAINKPFSESLGADIITAFEKALIEERKMRIDGRVLEQIAEQF